MLTYRTSQAILLGWLKRSPSSGLAWFGQCSLPSKRGENDLDLSTTWNENSLNVEEE
jgi:hypothetical protein